MGHRGVADDCALPDRAVTVRRRELPAATGTRIVIAECVDTSDPPGINDVVRKVLRPVRVGLGRPL
jgi:hypothetical protein